MSQLVSSRIFTRQRSFLALSEDLRTRSANSLLPPGSFEGFQEAFDSEQDALANVDQIVGLEIESEGIQSWSILSRRPSLWTTTRDDSLRGDYKLECISRPLAGDSLRVAIYQYVKNAAQYEAPFSWRCSTHLHMNCLHLTPQEVASLSLLTFAADNFFYAAGSEARRSNYNCRPLSLLWPTAELCGTMARYLQRGHVQRAITMLSPRQGRAPDRYVGMNWHALEKFGTLELRHFPGSRDASQIIRWINMGSALVAAAQARSVTQVYDLIQRGVDTFGQTVFQRLWDRLRYDGYEADWRECVEGIEHFMTCFRHSPDSARSLDGILRSGRAIQ